MENRKPRIVLAIDFDNTIAYSDYPEILGEVGGAVRTINKLYDEGYGIIINTCREGLALAGAIRWLDAYGVKRDYVNCNFPHRIEYFRADCRKISADCYIDDKNIYQLGKDMKWELMYGMITDRYKHIID